MSGFSDLLFTASETQLSELRKQLCQTPDEHAAFNCALARKPESPDREAILAFVMEARRHARGYPGEMVIEEQLLNSLIRFTEFELPTPELKALRPAADIVFERLQRLMFTP
jgi:hypothetical protein